jgi:hypothetical protein
MASRSYGLKSSTAQPYGSPSKVDDENKGLLADTELEFEALTPRTSQPGWSNRRVTGVAIVLLLLILCGFFANAVLYPSPPPSNAHLHFNGDTLRSNGTHDFKRTVLIVSIDGLRCEYSRDLLPDPKLIERGYRADYLDRGLTPHLLDISKQGIRAKYMTPIFPVCTTSILLKLNSKSFLRR